MSFYDPIKMHALQKVKEIHISITYHKHRAWVPFTHSFSPFRLFLSPLSILTDLYYRLPSIQALEVQE